MPKLRLPKGAHKDVVRSSPKTTHVSKDVVRSSPKTTHNRIKNLKHYAYPAKLPTGTKIGATVKTTKKRKSSNKLKGN
jgi:hypothetical protein